MSFEMNRSEQKIVLESFRKTLTRELHNLKQWPGVQGEHTDDSIG